MKISFSELVNRELQPIKKSIHRKTLKLENQSLSESELSESKCKF
jgi:hypothetical protein